jgi:DNA-binding CsgD family transcriptional regulator
MGGTDGCPLTKRQLEVLKLLYDGLTYRQAAHRLGIAESTARSHMVSAFKVLDVPNAAAAVALMCRKGWWAAPPPEPGPLVEEFPFLAAYVAEFDRWLASGMRDKNARDGMTIALWGHQNQQPARKETA